MRDPVTYKTVVMNLMSHNISNVEEWLSAHSTDLYGKTEQEINEYIGACFKQKLPNIRLVIEDKAIGYETWKAACGMSVEVISTDGISKMLDKIKSLPRGPLTYIIYDKIGPEVVNYKSVNITACNLKYLRDIKQFCEEDANKQLFKYVNTYTGFESSILSFTDWAQWLEEAPGFNSKVYTDRICDIEFVLKCRTAEEFTAEDLGKLHLINKELHVYGSLEKTATALLHAVLGTSDIRIGKTNTGECYNKNCANCNKCKLKLFLSNRKQKLHYLFTRTYGFLELRSELNAQGIQL